jgi:hypothetical protein
MGHGVGCRGVEEASIPHAERCVAGGDGGADEGVVGDNLLFLHAPPQRNKVAVQCEELVDALPCLCDAENQWNVGVPTKLENKYLVVAGAGRGVAWGVASRSVKPCGNGRSDGQADGEARIGIALNEVSSS